MPDRPTYRPVYKALHRPLTVWGVDRRLFFLALLMGAATFNLFYSFLAGLLMFGGLYGFAAVGDDARPGDAADSARVVAAPAPVRPRQSTSASTSRWRRGERSAASSATTARPAALNGLIALWGFVDDTTFLTKAGHVGRRLSRCGASTPRGLTHAQRQALVAPVRGGAPAAGRALPRLSVRAQADASTRFVAGAVRAAGRARGRSSVARRT